MHEGQEHERRGGYVISCHRRAVINSVRMLPRLEVGQAKNGDDVSWWLQLSRGAGPAD